MEAARLQQLLQPKTRVTIGAEHCVCCSRPVPTRKLAAVGTARSRTVSLLKSYLETCYGLWSNCRTPLCGRSTKSEFGHTYAQCGGSGGLPVSRPPYFALPRVNKKLFTRIAALLASFRVNASAYTAECQLLAQQPSKRRRSQYAPPPLPLCYSSRHTCSLTRSRAPLLAANAAK